MAIQLAERLAPDWVEAQAFAAWGRPQRSAPRWGAEVESARRFTLEAAGHALAAWEWGVGSVAPHPAAQGEGGGTRPTALLVHGWSGNAAQMGSFVAPLVARGFHVVAVDLPSHGESPGRFATLPMFADVLASLGARLQPEVVLAHSLGATATAYAMTFGPAPARVVLLAPPAQLPPYLKHFTQYVGLSDAMHARLLRRVERLIHKPVSELDLRVHAPQLGHVAPLIIHDAADVVVPLQSSRELAAAWPGATLLETKGLSHDRVRRDAEVVTRAVAFLAAPLRSPRAESRGEESHEGLRGHLAVRSAVSHVALDSARGERRGA